MRFYLKYLLLLIILTLHYRGLSQFAIAGTPGIFYTDIVPDTLIDYGGSFGGTTEYYYFDVNNDSQNDLRLDAVGINGLGAGDDYLLLRPLSSNVFIRFKRFDYVYNPWVGNWNTDVALPLINGDTINSSTAIWRSTNQYLTDNSFASGASKNVQDWVGNTDKFIGIRYITVNDTVYGWIRVYCPMSNRCSIKDYSFFNSTIGSEEYYIENNKLFPNPSNEGFTYILNKNEKDVKCWLYDLNGKEIQTEFSKQSETNYFIDTKRIIDGIYFLEIKTSEGIIRKKIVIQH